MVEAELVLNKDVREKYHVEFYGRFGDGILLIISGTPDSMREFIDSLKTRSRFFKLKVESINRNSAVMLDLVVSKGFIFESIGSRTLAYWGRARRSVTYLAGPQRAGPRPVRRCLRTGPRPVRRCLQTGPRPVRR